jgi:cytidine deaminase
MPTKLLNTKFHLLIYCHCCIFRYHADFVFMKDFVLVPALEDLDPESIDLVRHAERALSNAHAPYSEFHVGAALLLDNGVIVTGTNQENAAYPSGMCAERVALFALASQYPAQVIKKLAVVARHRMGTELTPATCCGGCRQVMLEFEHRQEKPFEVVMQTEDREWVKAPSAQSLLPFCFTSTTLRAAKIN